MHTLTLFDIFRRMLLLIVVCYSAVKLISFIWRWNVSAKSPDRTRRVLTRYLEVSVLRVRWRPFRGDLVQIAVLLGVLGVLIMLHP